jgi:hypothetical protein
MPQRPDEALEGALIGKPGMGVEELQLAGAVRIREHRKHQGKPVMESRLKIAFMVTVATSPLLGAFTYIEHCGASELARCQALPEPDEAPGSDNNMRLRGPQMANGTLTPNALGRITSLSGALPPQAFNGRAWEFSTKETESWKIKSP